MKLWVPTTLVGGGGRWVLENHLTYLRIHAHFWKVSKI
jgi:hypothetical protein